MIEKKGRGEREGGRRGSRRRRGNHRWWERRNRKEKVRVTKAMMAIVKNGRRGSLDCLSYDLKNSKIGRAHV